MRGTFEEPPTGLVPWFSKLREILTLHFAASPSPLRGKPTQAQDVVEAGVDRGEEPQPVAQTMMKMALGDDFHLR